ncbi:MAG: hypothetical protein ACRDGA_03410 [Bacteroidota bacterium]
MNRFILPTISLIGFSCMFWTCKDGGVTPPANNQDTTSHNFSWRTFVLGDGAGSILRDVAIINDTLAYAVGEVRMKDSLGNWDPEIYNAAK